MKQRKLHWSEGMDNIKPLHAEKAFVFALFERALRDFLSLNISPKYTEIAREAETWLMSEDLAPYSASWWAEISELEHILLACRLAIKSINANNKTKADLNKNCCGFRGRYGARK